MYHAEQHHAEGLTDPPGAGISYRLRERHRGEEGTGISYSLRDRGERKGQEYHIG